jgi:hypothetical protein
MGGSSVTASCNCVNYVIETSPTTGSQITYKPCNAEDLVIENVPAGYFSASYCVADNVFSYTNTLNNLTADKPCIQSNCQSCDCYEFWYQTSIAAGPHYISYIPCGTVASATQSIGPFGPLETGSFICSFPWLVQVSGSLDIGGVIRQVNSGSCQQLNPSSSYVGQIVSGAVIIHVTGSYPNQGGLLMTTQSISGSALERRWGYYGTVTGINNRNYGTGAANTLLLHNYTPNTSSIAANMVYGKTIGGFSNVFLPSYGEYYSSSLNNIIWPAGVVANNYVSLILQPMLYKYLTSSVLLLSDEKHDGTTAQRQIYARTGISWGANDNDIDKNSTKNVFNVNAAIHGFVYFTSSISSI